MRGDPQSVALSRGPGDFLSVGKTLAQGESIHRLSSNDKWLTWWPEAWKEEGWEFREKEIWDRPGAGLMGGDARVTILVSRIDDSREHPRQVTTQPSSVL